MNIPDGIDPMDPLTLDTTLIYMDTVEPCPQTDEIVVSF